MKFLVYNEYPAATGSIIPALETAFQGTRVRVSAVNAEKLTGGILHESDTVGLVLPGILGEHSNYPEKIGLAGLRDIDRALENNGIVLLTFCAGTSFISRRTVYEPEGGMIKRRTNRHPLFNAVSKGPRPGYYRPYDSENRMSDLAIIPVSFGAGKIVGMAYGNGPALILDSGRSDDYEVLARYHGEDGPVAAAAIPRGRGLILAFGIHPEIGPVYVSSGNANGTVQRLSQELRQHEEGRQEFMAMITDRIITQIRRRGTRPSEAPSIKAP